MRRLLLGIVAAAVPLLTLTWPCPARADWAKLDEKALAARIDEHVGAGWKAKKAVPAPVADDAEFVRRIHLDLAGRIPDILAARDFLDNPAKDKREKLVARLLDGDRYPVHFANVYKTWWFPGNANNPFFVANPGAEAWLRDEFKKNTGYDKMVATLVGAPGATGSPYGANVQQFFYQSHGNMPENIAAATSRLFLGVKVECAQCHNHPFAKWTRKQFWEQAAFFTGPMFAGRFRVDAEGRAIAIPPGKLGEIEIPGTGKMVQARYLDGNVAHFESGEDPRAALARWMIAADNPYFARAAVNRVWEYFLGTGLVEPVDEGGPDNPASHPELLDELARQFALHKFDMKYLIKAITSSQAYQLTSKSSHPSQADPRLFARMKVRGLSPEQLFDSLALATGHPEEELSTADPRFRGRVGVPNTPRAEFLRRFPNQDKRTEQTTSILQALYLMNGKIVADATSLEHNKNLAIIAEATSVRTTRRVEQLYLITLSRKPRPEERARLVKYVDRGGPTEDSRLALCDVFWALLNSSEFCVNH